MLSLKKIVCPTDFSDSSYGALNVGKEVADRFGSELILVHVVSNVPIVPTTAFPTVPGPPAPSSFNVASYQEEIEKNAVKALDDVVKKHLSGVENVRTMVTTGDAADEIVEAARKEKADLIVIATHGTSGLQRIFFGSVAEKVIRYAQCNILSVKVKESS